MLELDLGLTVRDAVGLSTLLIEALEPEDATPEIAAARLLRTMSMSAR